MGCKKEVSFIWHFFQKPNRQGGQAMNLALLTRGASDTQ